MDFELENLKPFCAFVGPNASGKSNIFEALEFTNYVIRYIREAPGFFGGIRDLFNRKSKADRMIFDFVFDSALIIDFELQSGGFLTGRMHLLDNDAPLDVFSIRTLEKRKEFIKNWLSTGHEYQNEYEQFVDSFSRIFVGKSSLNRTPPVNTRLSQDASNLAQIIGMIFEKKVKRNDFTEWLRILIPEFKNIEVKKSNIDGSYDFFIYEKGSKGPFSRNLVSDGTYNILSLMAAVYQGAQPQFLCIEEPENGLHPQAIELLVDFFREKCEEEGHHIWLNTHSPTLVRCLEIDEIILINKANGETQAKQLTKNDEVNIKTDEAWLSNARGGGVL